VGKPRPVTVPAIERGSHEIRERPLFFDSSESSVLSGNVLEGDLTQLVEKLHQLETEQLKRFVEDLQTALREVALEPSDDLGTDVVTPPVISAGVSSTPDEVEHAAEEIAPERSDRFGTDAVMSQFISAPVSSISTDIGRIATEVEQGPSDRLEPDVVTSSVVSARMPPPADGINHATEELALDPSGHLESDVVPPPVISAPVSSPPAEINHAAEEITLERGDRFGTDVATPPAPMSSRPGEMQHPVEEIALEPKDRLELDAVTSPMISALVPSLPAEIEHVAQEGALQPNDRLEPDAETPPVISAPVSLAPDELERADRYPSIMAVPVQTLVPDARGSSSRSRSRWGKRTGLLLALSAVTASIPWELPVLFANFPQAGPTTPEPVVRRDAPEPSQQGEAAEEIATIEGTTAPAAQASSLPLPVNEIEGLIDRGDRLLRQGDIIAARSFYERAAASGSARAASGVARTFDPQFLSRLGVVGIRGDPERAATWYRNASQAAVREGGPHLNTDGDPK